MVIRFAAGLAFLLVSAGPAPAQDALLVDTSVQNAHLQLASPAMLLQIIVDDSLCVMWHGDPIALAPGRHNVKVLNPDRLSWSRRDYESWIEIAPGDTARLSVDFERTRLLRSIPDGARVLRGDEELGRTPLSLMLSPPFPMKLRLLREGYTADTLSVRPRSSRMLVVQLQSKQPLARSRLDKKHRLRKRRQFRKRALVSFGISTVAAISALYWRDLADESYQEYLSSSHPKTMNHHYDLTRKYDGYKDASFGVFQVSAALGIYFFLRY